MHQQEAVIVNFTKQDEQRLKGFVSSALQRVARIHLNRFPRCSPELYKIFISKTAQSVLKLPSNLERGFEFNGKRAIMYTSKPETPMVLSYASCEVQGNNRELGSQSVIYLEEPAAPGPICIIR